MTTNNLSLKSHVLMYVRAGHIYCHPVVSSFYFSSPYLSRRRLDVYHTSTHGVALVRIYNSGLKCTARWKYRTGKIAQKSPSGHHGTTLSGYIFATKARVDNRKKMLNSNVSSTCPHNMINFGPLTAEIRWRVWDTPAYFNGFRVLALLLQRRRSTEANQTLDDVWLSPGLVHYIYIFGSSCPLTEFCHVQNSLCVQVLRSPIIGSVTARHFSSGRQPNFVALSRGRHLYATGRPTRWALAHILVENDLGIDRSP